MYYVLIVIHSLVCLFLIGTILLQAGKGADMGALFGGGGAQTLFGASGGQTFMSKLTTALAVVFMFTCLGLAYVSSHSASVMRDETEPAPAEDSVPAEVPAEAPAEAPTPAPEAAPAAAPSAAPEATPPTAAPAAPAPGGETKTP